jgi:hypothetical protein
MDASQNPHQSQSTPTRGSPMVVPDVRPSLIHPVIHRAHRLSIRSSHSTERFFAVSSCRFIMSWVLSKVSSSTGRRATRAVFIVEACVGKMTVSNSPGLIMGGKSPNPAA